MAGLEFTGRGAAETAAAARALGELDNELPADVRKVIVEKAEQLAAAARQKVQQEPTHGPKHTGLRRQVAAGVAVKPTPSGAIVTTSMPLADEAIIPRGFDNPARGWRHPVFGHRNVWVRQRGAFSWFLDTMQAGQDDITNGIEQQMERAAEKVSRSL